MSVRVPHLSLLRRGAPPISRPTPHHSPWARRLQQPVAHRRAHTLSQRQRTHNPPHPRSIQRPQPKKQALRQHLHLGPGPPGKRRHPLPAMHPPAAALPAATRPCPPQTRWRLPAPPPALAQTAPAPAPPAAHNAAAPPPGEGSEAGSRPGDAGCAIAWSAARPPASPYRVTRGQTAANASSVTDPGRYTTHGSSHASTTVDSTPNAVGPRIEHRVDPPVQVREHVLRGRRAHMAEPVRTRRRDRHPSGSQQRPRHRVRRHAHAHPRTPRRPPPAVPRPHAAAAASAVQAKNAPSTAAPAPARPRPPRPAAPGRTGAQSADPTPAALSLRRSSPPPPHRVRSRPARTPSRSQTRRCPHRAGSLRPRLSPHGSPPPAADRLVNAASFTPRPFVYSGHATHACPRPWPSRRLQAARRDRGQVPRR